MGIFKKEVKVNELLLAICHLNLEKITENGSLICNVAPILQEQKLLAGFRATKIYTIELTTKGFTLYQKYEDYKINMGKFTFKEELKSLEKPEYTLKSNKNLAVMFADEQIEYTFKSPEEDTRKHYKIPIDTLQVGYQIEDEISRPREVTLTSVYKYGVEKYKIPYYETEGICYIKSNDTILDLLDAGIFLMKGKCDRILCIASIDNGEAIFLKEDIITDDISYKTEISLIVSECIHNRCNKELIKNIKDLYQNKDEIIKVIKALI